MIAILIFLIQALIALVVLYWLFVIIVNVCAWVVNLIVGDE